MIQRFNNRHNVHDGNISIIYVTAIAFNLARWHLHFIWREVVACNEDFMQTNVRVCICVSHTVLEIVIVFESHPMTKNQQKQNE